MSRIRPSFVLGYHGCDRSVALKVAGGQEFLTPSKGDHHWMGKGIYFWEGDPVRAHEWALQKKARGKCPDPFVLGAVIDLGHCLDLLVRENAPIVASAYESFRDMRAKAGLAMPENTTAPNDSSPDLVLRYRDCAVIDHLHKIIGEKGGTPYDTVRAAFAEGKPIFEGGRIYDKNHVQIAVCNTAQIHGYFIPLNVANIPSIGG